MATAIENFHNLSLFDNYTNYEKLRNGIKPIYKESDRLKSFRNWPLSFIDPHSLAKAGFYYTNKEDRVRCSFCNIQIMKWQPGENAMAEHRRWSDKCPFVRGIYCGNIPTEDDDSDVPMSVSSDTRDKKNYYGIEIRPNSFPEWKAINLTLQKSDQLKGPRYPEYKSFESRLQSFAEWPPSIKQKPDQLAAAGFYYNGKGDQTICFSCGLGLKDWADEDDPWEQHTKWSNCTFVQSQKGAEYCSEVHRRQKAVLTPEEVLALQIPANNKSPSSNTASSSKSLSPPAESMTIHKPKLVSNTKEISVSLCKICHLKEKSVLFLPCRHIAVCEDCASSLTSCVVCNRPLEANVRVSVSMS